MFVSSPAVEKIVPSSSWPVSSCFFQLKWPLWIITSGALDTANAEEKINNVKIITKNNNDKNDVGNVWLTLINSVKHFAASSNFWTNFLVKFWEPLCSSSFTSKLERWKFNRTLHLFQTILRQKTYHPPGLNIPVVGSTQSSPGYLRREKPGSSWLKPRPPLAHSTPMERRSVVKWACWTMLHWWKPGKQAKPSVFWSDFYVGLPNER